MSKCFSHHQCLGQKAFHQAHLLLKEAPVNTTGNVAIIIREGNSKGIKKYLLNLTGSGQSRLGQKLKKILTRRHRVKET